MLYSAFQIEFMIEFYAFKIQSVPWVITKRSSCLVKPRFYLHFSKCRIIICPFQKNPIPFRQISTLKKHRNTLGLRPDLIAMDYYSILILCNSNGHLIFSNEPISSNEVPISYIFWCLLKRAIMKHSFSHFSDFMRQTTFEY